MTVRTKITALVVILSAVAVIAVGVFTYQINVAAEREKMAANLNIIADGRTELLETRIEKLLVDLRAAKNAPGLSELLSGDTLSNGAGGFDLFDMMGAASEGDSTAAQEVEPDTSQQQLGEVRDTYSFVSVTLTDAEGQVVKSTDAKLRDGSNFPDPDGQFIDRASSAEHFGPVKLEDGKYYMFMGAPVNGHIFIAQVDFTPLFNEFVSTKGLGTTGEVVIARIDPATRKVILINRLRNTAGGAQQVLNLEHPGAQAIKLALDGKPGAGVTTDYRGEQVLGAWRKVNKFDWAVMAKIDASEVTGVASAMMTTYVIVGIAIVLLAFAMAMIFASTLTQPLNSMRNTLELVSKGVLPEQTNHRAKDEFGLMADKVDNLVSVLKNNAEFAQRVGEGKFDAAFQPASDDDALGQALINMRNNLIENEHRDTERNWIVRGVAEVGEILRAHDSLAELGDDVIQFIINKISAIQGSFYVVNDEQGEPLIEMKASYAYSRKKYLKKSFRFAEGLVGQAAIEKDTVMRTEIPDDYVSITSGLLGEQKPTCILIVPLITNEEVFGVLEFAGFKRFNPSQVKFVQELSLILARTIFNIKVNERTRRLLAESQAMSNELKEKQEVLRQNAEEMQATQEELQRSNKMLEEQVEEVNRTQKRMQLLLENASEVITIFEEDGTIRYISPSVEPILGYSQKEMQGNRDVDKVHPEGRETYEGIFKQLAANPDEKVTAQFEYQTKDGHYIWLEATGTNFMSNAAIHGYILNARDITERRRAEQEQRMRSKMQALSENSPDLIARLEHEAISYINPVIESYSGKSPANFLNKRVNEAALDHSILENWLNIVEQVKSTNEKLSTEMDFPSELGKRVMQVNAIPEFDEHENLESVLVVSHDITERKLIELEIQNKNKKINDSINYAKRIQNAILPSTRLINKVLSDSFILYKPRDVVSGDFPWFVQTKTDLFIAAVDCTGHGVPGALLSLIGYFLLNDIVRSRKVSDPGKILDLLDEGVTQTLRQDQDDSATKDGMDIALCRINLDTNEVHYAGAHRPLYIMKKTGMDEIKGNKFPIGGGIFKNQTNFTTHTLKMQKGESIYFSSDGYPDQFGGPESRKFGPKRVREIIERVHTAPMREASQVFDQEWENWRGDQKQTDDVLLIGIKF